jgi:hypothetical protein
LPRADARPLTEGEKKAVDKYRKAYTEALKEAVPSVFKENPNQPPKEVPNVIKRKPGRPPKVSSEMIGRKPKKTTTPPPPLPNTRSGLPPRLDRLLLPSEMMSPFRREVAERKASLLTEEEMKLSDTDVASIAQRKYIDWRRRNPDRYY